MPQFVERVSACGTLRMHALRSIPPGGIDIDVTMAEHTFDPPPNVLSGRALVLQGRVVHSDATSTLLSHGGLLLSLAGSMPALSDRQSRVVPDAMVRTIIRW
jgi:hypothetical protein